MAYLGTKPQSGFISQEANQYFTGLTQNYVDLNQSISSLSSVIILVNGVVQENSTLTLTTSSRITLGATLVASDKVTCIYLAKISSTQAPATGTVTLDMLSASGTKSSSTFLRGDNSFASAGLSNWSENSGNLLPSNASYGIYLGTNSANASSSPSNLLNDYEFGTFTPDADPTNNSFSAKGTMTGFYTKVGNLVHYQASIGVTTNGSASGNIEVYNLPFTTASTGIIHTINRGRETEVNGSAFDTIQSRNTTTLVMLAPPFGNGAVYSLNGTYRV